MSVINATNIIDINNLTFSYNAKKPLIDIGSWHVKKQAHVFLHGASGSGKSTFLNLLSGILTPHSGTIDLLEQGFSTLSHQKRDAFRAKHIGIVFQEFNLIPFLTISENINLARYFAKNSNAESNDYIAEIFERLQLTDTLLTQRADSLSVGQRQRVSIARALVNRPKILIADEPTSALDSDNRDEFMQLLLELTDESGGTVIFVSHDTSLQGYFDHVQDVNDFR